MSACVSRLSASRQRRQLACRRTAVSGHRGLGTVATPSGANPSRRRSAGVHPARTRVCVRVCMGTRGRSTRIAPSRLAARHAHRHTATDRALASALTMGAKAGPRRRNQFSCSCPPADRFGDRFEHLHLLQGEVRQRHDASTWPRRPRPIARDLNRRQILHPRPLEIGDQPDEADAQQALTDRRAVDVLAAAGPSSARCCDGLEGASPSRAPAPLGSRNS